MVKRKCGTCRHFKDGGIAGSGWCQHPARRDLQHMVLVRKTELACRNGWDQDLWEPAGHADDSEIQSPTIPTPHINPPERDRRPLYGAPAEPDSREMFTDRLQSISMAPPRPSASKTPEPFATTMGVQGASEESDQLPAATRSEVREARRRLQEQRIIEQRRHQETLLSEAGQLLDTPSASAPVIPSRIPPALPRRRKADRAWSSDDGADNPAPDRPTPEKRLPPERESSIDFSARNGRFSAPRKRDDLPPMIVAPVRHVEKPVTPPKRRVSGETEPLPVIDEQTPSSQEPSGRFGARPAEPDTGTVPQRSERGRDRAELPLPLPPVPQRDTRWMPVSGTPNLKQPLDDSQRSLPVAVPMARMLDPIDESERLRTMPRCCATCRDFKPIGDGSRGWCENVHAFAERRMVESGTIGCRTSFGTWWMPTDDIWLERADTTYHSRPTPILDELMRTDAGFDGKQTMGSHPEHGV